MKTKQVVAFLMAATLTVTSGGVSALASQNAAEALQEETAIEELIIEEGTNGEIRENVGDTFDDKKVTADEAIGATVELSGPTETEKVAFGDPAKLNVKISDVKGGKVSTVQIVNADGNKVVAEDPNPAGKTEFSFDVVPEFSGSGDFTDQTVSYYAVALIHTTDNSVTTYYSKSGDVHVTVTKKLLKKSEYALPSLGDVEVSGKNVEPSVLDGIAKQPSLEGISGAVTDAIPDAKESALKEKLKELNKNSAYSKYGIWEVSGDPQLKDTSINLDFVFNYGYGAEGDDKYKDVSVSFNLIQKAMFIKVVEYGEDIIEPFPTLSLNSNKGLEAVVFPDKAAKDIEIEWKSSNEKAVKLSDSAKETVKVANAVGAGKSTITATAQDGSDVSGSVDIEVENGITTDSIDFSMFPERLEYRGDGKVSGYLDDILQSANAEAKGRGKYSITLLDESVDGSKVRDQQNQDLGKGADFEYIVTFTLDSSQNAIGAGWTSDIGLGDTDARAYSKKMKLNVYPKVITRDEALAEILGDNMGKTSFPFGTTLKELTSQSPKGKYEIVWYEEDGKTAAKDEDAISAGSNTYVMTYGLNNNEGFKGYVLAADDHTYKLTITIEEPKLDVEIVAGDADTPHDKKTDAKFDADATDIKLYAKVNGVVIEDRHGNDNSYISPLDPYYELTYNWILDGESCDNTGSDISNASHKILDWPDKGAGEYTLIVSGKITDKGRAQSWYLNADAAKQDAYETLTARNTIKVELTKVKFGQFEFKGDDVKSQQDAFSLVYGSTAGNKFTGSITAANIQSYTVCYREVVNGNEQEEKTFPTYTLTEAERALFSSGNTIGEKYEGVDIGNLDAGEYVFYVRVVTSDETVSSPKVTLTVDKKPITDASYEDKIEVSAIQYGDKYSDAKVSFMNEDDLNSMVQLKVKEEDVAKKAAPVKVTVVAVNGEDLKNYRLVGDWKFTKILEVAPYSATITILDKTIAAGAELDFNDIEWTADILDINGEKKEDVFKLDFEVRKDGAKVNFLTPGTYELFANATPIDNNYLVEEVKSGILTVGDGGVETNGIQFNKKQIVFTNIGKTREFAAAVVPATESNAGLTFESSDESVATVEVTDAENGKAVVTAVANGEADIVVTAPNGVSGKLHVTVKQEPKKVVISRSGKTVSGTISVSVGKKYNFDAKVQPSTVFKKGVTWSTSNAKIATVSKKGKVTVKAAGTVKIKATAKGGAKSKTITLKAK